MSPRQVHQVAVREEKAVTVRASKAMAMDLREKVVRASVARAVPVVRKGHPDRKGFPARAVLKDRMAAARKRCCNKSCRWMQTVMEH
jgi:hypothetical protein